MQINRSFTQSMNVKPVSPALLDNGVTLRRPNRAADFQAIAHLRQEINLAVHTELDPYFSEYEKKETH